MCSERKYCGEFDAMTALWQLTHTSLSICMFLCKQLVYFSLKIQINRYAAISNFPFKNTGINDLITAQNVNEMKMYLIQ